MTTTANWYHAHQDSVKRSEGKSAVGLIAYITGQAMKDERTGVWCIRNHPGEVLAWGTVTPDWAPAYLTDPSHISKAWNDVERSETRKNSIVAAHWNVAGSREFSHDDHEKVACEIASRIMQRYGVMVTYGIHKPTDHGDDRNWHYHFGHNMRRVTSEGFGEKAREIIDKKSFVDETVAVRALVADVLNDHLARIGSNERVTHLSYAELGITQEPTKHLGNKQNQSELKGIDTPTGRENKDIRERNARYERERDASLAESREHHRQAQVIDLLAERIKRLETEIAMSDDPEAKRRHDADQQLASQIGSYRDAEVAQLRAEDFIRVNKEESDRARKDEEKLKAEANARVDAGDITDPKARYAQASIQFDIRRPYASLCDVAAAENASYHREQDSLAKQAAGEKDPARRHIILLRKEIEHADYMAITSERLAGISYVITGRREAGSQFDIDSKASRDWREQGRVLREKRRDLQKNMDGKVYEEVDRAVKDLERGVYSKNRPDPKMRRENNAGWTDRKEVSYGQPDCTQPDFASRPVFRRDMPVNKQPEPLQHNPNQREAAPREKEDSDTGKQQTAGQEVTSQTAERHAALQARLNKANARAQEGGRSKGGMSY